MRRNNLRLLITDAIQTLHKAVHYSRPRRSYVIAIFFLSVITSALGVAEPLALKYIFDSLGAPSGAQGLVVKGIGLLLGLALLKESLAGISGWLYWKTRIEIHYNLLSVTVEKLYNMSVDSLRYEGVGAVMNKLERGIQGFISVVSSIVFNVLPSLTYLVLAVFAMVHLDWRLTLAVLVFVPIPAVIQTFVSPAQTARERLLFKRWAKIYARFNEVLSGIITVRSFSMEQYERQRFLNDVDAINQKAVEGIGFDTRVGAFQSFMVGLARIAALALGSILVLRGELTAGTMVAFLGYISALFGPVQGLTGIYRTIKTASVSIDHIFSILDSKNFIPDAPGAIELKAVSGHVQFRNVHFHYDHTGRQLLKGIDLEVAPGETIAIVGPSGSGKTTMMSLLQRFYDVNGGSVTIDGTDVRSLQQHSLRKQIGVVMQDVLLFNDTVRNNIAYARPSASDREIIAAAKAANIHDLVMRLEDGYDTMLGERGGMLSMGERQRIAIARAILKDPPILILDEATSALDAELEAAVQADLDQLTRNRTTFIISHRLATVVNADKILVLRDGHVIEAGSHKELLHKNGYYASLVQKQTKDLVYDMPMTVLAQGA